MPKVGAISGDLLVKIALGAVVLGVGYWAIKKTFGAVGETVGNAYSAVVDTATTSLNPASDQNLAYRGVNAIGGALAGAEPGGWSLGSWLYDITHPNENFLTPTTTKPAAHTAYWKS